MSTEITTNREIRDFLIRSKADVADPTAWNYIDNNSFIETVGGTADDGDYVVTIDPVAAGVASIPITFTRGAGETNSGIGDGIVTETDTLLAVAGSDRRDPSVLSTYIRSATNTAGAVTFIAQPNAPNFTITDTAPGTGTLTLNLDEVFPITWNTLGYGPMMRSRTELEIVVLPVSSTGVLLDPNAATMTITIRRMVERRGLNSAYEDGVANSTAAAYNIGDAYRIGGGGGRFGIATTAMTGTITSLDHFEIWAREICT